MDNESVSAYSVRRTSDDGFIVTGAVSVNQSFDLWVMKLSSSGATQWQKSYGGSRDDYGLWVEQTSDDGYIVVGQTFSFGLGSNDVWVLKLNETGDVQWQKTLGGARTDVGLCIKPTPDGGSIVAAVSSSFTTAILLDFWLIKLNSSGDLEWQKTYQTPGDEFVLSISINSDGGYFVSGTIDPTGLGAGDLWALRLDSAGMILWQKSYDGLLSESGVRGTQQTTDGGFIVAALMIEQFNDPDGGDILVLKLDQDGNIQWQNLYGGTGPERVAAIQQTNDGNFILAGQTESFGPSSFWLLKLDSVGEILWQKAYADNDSQLPSAVQQSIDGGYIVSGSDFRRPLSTSWILKVDQNGEIDPSCPFVSDTNAVRVTASTQSLTTTATVADTFAATVSSAAVVNTASVIETQQCAAQCLFCDFFDDGILDSNWNYFLPTWSENGGALIGNATMTETTAVAEPAFNGCDVCSVDTTIESTGGNRNRVSLFTHFRDLKNHIEVLFNEERDKVILKQRQNGIIVKKIRRSLSISPNIRYHVSLSYDGAQMTLIIDGVTVLSENLSTLPAPGTVGFKVKNTTASFGEIAVY